ncbi:hypothetical protein DFH28DRAFT_161011 [Melampsora americana]|nr:hypothetical protein DFH28DRAFT_161011 [Melampsora americana]
MYQSPKHFLWSFIGVLLQLSLSVRSVSNGVMDISMLESTQELQGPTTEFRRPIDKALLNQQHLNTWRDLRTIEEVAKHCKVPCTFRRRVEELVGQLLKKQNYLTDGNQAMSQGIPKKQRYNPIESLYMLLYQVKQVLKAHSPQIDHQEIENISEGIIKIFKKSFNVRKKHSTRTLFNSFLDAIMSSFSRYLLMQTFRQNALHVRTDIHTIIKNTNEFQGIGDNESQLEHVQMYQEYMRLIEVFDILAAGGLQDKNVILKMTPSHIGLPQTIRILSEYSSKPTDLHYYITNDTPYNYPRPLKLPIFGYPFEMNGWDPSQIEDQVHKLWSNFEPRDLEIALQLIRPVEETSKSETKFPEEVTQMEGYKLLLRMTSDPQYKQMWISISRSINLVSKLEAGTSEAQSILWHILQSEFKYLPQHNLDPKKAELQIENSVMFYLFLRRMGEVLQAVFSSLETPPAERVSKAQCMMYYWSLVLYKPPTTTYRRDRKAKWMELGLGRLYLDHLLSSRKLNQLYQRMRTTQDSEQALSDSSSAVNFSNNFGERNIVDFFEHIENLGHASSDFITNSIDRLDFISPRKKRTNPFKKMVYHDLKSGKSSYSDSPKQKFLMHDGLETNYLNSIPKKARTKRIEYIPTSDDETEISNNILSMRE